MVKEENLVKRHILQVFQAVIDFLMHNPGLSNFYHRKISEIRFISNLTMELFSNEYFMNMALKEARIAYEEGEVPVGAVIITNRQVIAKAYNQAERLNDATAHAEMLAITAATSYLANKYLDECTLYVTLEPCVMCAGALRWSQIGKIVFATEDLKHGFMRYGKELLHPKTKCEYGILQEPCSELLSSFFKGKRELV